MVDIERRVRALEAKSAALEVILGGFLVQNLQAKPKPFDALKMLRDSWRPLIANSSEDFA